MSAAGGAADWARALVESDRVRLVALVGRADLNGRDGVVRSALDASGRIRVEVPGEANTLALKPQNLQPMRGGLESAEEVCCSLPSCATHEGGVKDLLRCSRCQVARYCDRKCQLAHFKLHKAECKRLNSDRLKAELEKSKRKESKSMDKARASMSATGTLIKQMMMQRGGGTPATASAGSGFSQQSLQQTIDMLKREKAGKLSEEEKRNMEKAKSYSALFQFTGVWSMSELPDPKSVDDVLEQAKDVLPALREKAEVWTKESTITGLTGGLEDKFAYKVLQVEKKVADLKEMDDKSRARLSAADLLSIRQDLQKRVSSMLMDIQTDLSTATCNVKQVCLPLSLPLSLSPFSPSPLSLMRACVHLCVCK